MQVIVYGMQVIQFSINTVFDRGWREGGRRQQTGDGRRETGDGRRENLSASGFRPPVSLCSRPIK